MKTRTENTEIEFGPVQKAYFNATEGAYSKVTPTEEKDGQITLTGREKMTAEKYFGQGGIYRGNKKSNPVAASKKFLIYGPEGKCSEVELPLVYPKPEKNELRLYLNAGGFKPQSGSIWFIFVSGNRLVIGTMLEKEWRSLGREDAEDDGYIAAIYNEAKAPQQIQTASSLIWKRNPQLAIARFEFVGYKCEADPSHKLFRSRSTGMPFLEAHHLLPMKYQKSFKDSLDMKDNIVALCPFCHRLIHHATVEETRPLLDTVLSKHTALIDRFKIKKPNLYRFYNCEDILAS